MVSSVVRGPESSIAMAYPPTAARSDSFNEPIVAMTAVGSYPQCAMQLAQRGSLPRPNLSHSVVSMSSRYVFAYPSSSR